MISVRLTPYVPLYFAAKKCDVEADELLAQEFQDNVRLLILRLEQGPWSHSDISKIAREALGFRYLHGSTTLPDLVLHMRNQFSVRYSRDNRTDGQVEQDVKGLVYKALTDFLKPDQKPDFTDGQWQQVIHLATFNETYKK